METILNNRAPIRAYWRATIVHMLFLLTAGLAFGFIFLLVAPFVYALIGPLFQAWHLKPFEERLWQGVVLSAGTVCAAIAARKAMKFYPVRNRRRSTITLDLRPLLREKFIRFPELSNLFYEIGYSHSREEETKRILREIEQLMADGDIQNISQALEKRLRILEDLFGRQRHFPNREISP